MSNPMRRSRCGGASVAADATELMPSIWLRMPLRQVMLKSIRLSAYQ
jgi:hypothetical protein